MLILDAHLDLAMNALEWNRDLTRPLKEIQDREKGLTDKKDRGRGTVCFPEMRAARIGLCVATLIARYVKPNNPLPGWHSPEQAWAQTQGQLAWYRAMEEAGQLIQITELSALRDVADQWEHSAGSNQPIGYILTLEGADSILSPVHLERAYQQGLRALGPAHYGPGTYAQGTDAQGGLTSKGRDLLKQMEEMGIILDVTHLADESFWEALDCFNGRVWASHNNCRALAPHQRQFSDEQIKALIARDAVIGGVLDAWMMIPDWVRGKTTPETSGLKLERLLDHLDHICQLAGNSRHIGIGSDLDGGFGREQTPLDLTRIADLARIPSLLAGRGYNEGDIRGVAHGNFIHFLEKAWSTQ